MLICGRLILLDTKNSLWEMWGGKVAADSAAVSVMCECVLRSGITNSVTDISSSLCAAMEAICRDRHIHAQMIYLMLGFSLSIPFVFAGLEALFFYSVAVDRQEVGFI